MILLLVHQIPLCIMAHTECTGAVWAMLSSLLILLKSSRFPIDFCITLLRSDACSQLVVAVMVNGKREGKYIESWSSHFGCYLQLWRVNFFSEFFTTTPTVYTLFGKTWEKTLTPRSALYGWNLNGTQSRGSTHTIKWTICVHHGTCSFLNMCFQRMCAHCHFQSHWRWPTLQLKPYCFI